MNRATYRMLAILIMGFSSALAYSQSPSWTARWLTNPSTTTDHGGRLCTDRRGNTYAAGLTSFDGTGSSSDRRIELNKYSPSGVLVWEFLSQPVNPGNPGDRWFAVTTDDQYVYLCTTEYKSGQGTNIVVRKFKSDDGDESSTWADSGDGAGVRSYNSNSTNNDFSADISLDSAGNVFVAGHCPGTNGDDLLLLKFAPVLEDDEPYTWAETHPTSNVDEEAVAIDTLPNGTTVVAGIEAPTGTSNWCAMRWNGGGEETMSSGRARDRRGTRLSLIHSTPNLVVRTRFEVERRSDREICNQDSYKLGFAVDAPGTNGTIIRLSLARPLASLFVKNEHGGLARLEEVFKVVAHSHRSRLARKTITCLCDPKCVVRMNDVLHVRRFDRSNEVIQVGGGLEIQASELSNSIESCSHFK